MSDRTLMLIIAGVLVVVFGVLWYRAWFLVPAPPVSITEPEPEQRQARRPHVHAVVTRCARVGRRTEMQGYVENTGSVDLRFVTVQSIWKNAEGLIVDTNVVYVVNQEVLAPGERKTFHDVTDLPNADKCNVRPLDWWS